MNFLLYCGSGSVEEKPQTRNATKHPAGSSFPHPVKFATLHHHAEHASIAAITTRWARRR